MRSGWSWYVVVITVANIVVWFWLLWWARSRRVAGERDATLGHAYDGIEERDAPLPRWWLWLFIGTLAFSVGYLALYPGLGNYGGLLGWSSTGQYDAEIERAERAYGPLYAAYAARPIPEVAADPAALATGQRIFANACAQCHGTDARGGPGFPDLTDADWLYGGDPQVIKTSILHGRSGLMPPFAPALGGDEGIAQVVAYVLSLSGRPVDAATAAQGKARYMTICVACHGADGRGNQAMGAPNLTDDVWLYGGTAEDIEHGLRAGRNGVMPAHGALLGDERAHVVAAYVYSLSRQPQP